MKFKAIAMISFNARAILDAFPLNIMSLGVDRNRMM